MRIRESSGNAQYLHSRETFEFRNVSFENHCHRGIENAFVDFEMRVAAYFGTDRGTGVTQTSIICKCALNTQRVQQFGSQKTRIPLWPFYIFPFNMLVLRAENSKN